MEGIRFSEDQFVFLTGRVQPLDEKLGRVWRKQPPSILLM
jgi:hypothetical protein